MSLMVDILEKRKEISALAMARDLLDRRGRDSSHVKGLIDLLRQELTDLKLQG